MSDSRGMTWTRSRWSIGPLLGFDSTVTSCMLRNAVVVGLAVMVVADAVLVMVVLVLEVGVLVVSEAVEAMIVELAVK